VIGGKFDLWCVSMCGIIDSGNHEVSSMIMNRSERKLMIIKNLFFPVNEKKTPDVH
jgi:hypothetical protein